MIEWRVDWAKRCYHWIRTDATHALARKFEHGTRRYGPHFDPPRDPLREARDEVYDLLAYIYAAESQRSHHIGLLRQAEAKLRVAKFGAPANIDERDLLVAEIHDAIEDVGKGRIG